jgi:hypothetical protein
MFFKKQYASVRYGTTPTVSYHPGVAGTHYRDMHSPTEMASSGKCTWTGINTSTPRISKTTCKAVNSNAPTDKSKILQLWLQ